KATEPFSSLALNQYATVWVQAAEFMAIRDRVDDLLLNPGRLDDLAPDARMEVLLKSAEPIVADLFQNPTPENINRAITLVGSCVHSMMRGSDAFKFINKLTSMSPYTLQHSMGTAVQCIILARKVGIDASADLKELGIAGLLHDIGNIKMRRELVEKKTPLTDAEAIEMQSHVQAGYDLLKNNSKISERAKRAILQHHEEIKGTGYPGCLKGNEIDLYARIVAICDTFTALTMDSSNSKGKSIFEAFQYMRENLLAKVDEELFKEFVLAYGGQMVPARKAS
ncbi:MAG: HD-GYP domain-containing protein, partial [Bdellovibrionota bacterium]